MRALWILSESMAGGGMKKLTVKQMRDTMCIVGGWQAVLPGCDKGQQYGFPYIEDGEVRFVEEGCNEKDELSRKLERIAMQRFTELRHREGGGPA